MPRTRFIITVATASFLVLGAGCSFKTTVQINNTNTTISTNTSVTTNSSTTGSFDTTTTPATNTGSSY